MPRPRHLDLQMCPFTICVDTREQAPFHFQNLTTDSRHHYRPLIVPTTRAALTTGDYSIVGYEDRVTVERKSLDDAFGTFGADRDRWERCLDRMRQIECSNVVIEADWKAVLSSIRPTSAEGRNFTGKSFYRSVIAWQGRYRNVHWWFCPTRDFAEITTFRLLERWWLDEMQKTKEQVKARGDAYEP